MSLRPCSSGMNLSDSQRSLKDSVAIFPPFHSPSIIALTQLLYSKLCRESEANALIHNIFLGIAVILKIPLL